VIPVAPNISVPAAGGKSSTQTLADPRYGFGPMTRVKDGFQVGLIVGRDHVDSSQPCQYNDKPWLSFEIGHSFAQ
jgi:hypothetical protein